MTTATLHEQAAIGARLGLALNALGIDAWDLAKHLGEVSDGPLRDVLVWTNADVSVLGLSASLRGDDPLLPRRMALLAAGITGSPALAQTVTARKGDVWIERWSDGRAAVAMMGRATLADDTSALGTLAFAGDEARQLGDRLALLSDRGPALRMLRTTVRRGEVETYDLGVQVDASTALAKLAQHAGELGIGDPQLRLLRNVHAVLAHGRPVLLRATMRAAVPQPGVAISYGAQTLDHALRVITGLATRSDAAKRFGTLTGALGSSAAKAVELQLGPVDPVPALVALDVAATA
jgi:hypothetical protein